MARNTIQTIRDNAPRDCLMDIAEMVRANRKIGGKKAKEIGLRGKRALRNAGFTAYDLFAQDAHDYKVPHCQYLLLEGCFPGSTLRYYQPLWRLGRVVVATASINPTTDLPSPNKTRKHGAWLNVRHSHNLPIPGLEPEQLSSEVDLFLLLLVRSDPGDAEKILSIEIAVLEPDFSGTIFRMPLDEFLAGYGDAAAAPTADAPTVLPTLKDGVRPFLGNEHTQKDDKQAKN